MGQVIRKDAAVEDILADARTTLNNAIAKEGDWRTAAEAQLAPVLALADGVRTRLEAARAALAPATASLGASDQRCDDLLGRVSDDVWNQVGRPAQDPALDILFPGGFSSYADGDVDEQPERMELLAELLELRIHPRLDEARARALASEVRESAAALRALVTETRPLRARAVLAQRMETAIARSAQATLARLKRIWKAAGRSEAEIHTVIPDRPAATKKPVPTPT
jgi:hypothetical protein